MNTLKRFAQWVISDDTGVSSKSLAAHMILGKTNDINTRFPRDPSDLGRCLRLLEIFPEWKERISEMECYGGVWSELVKHWKTLEASMAEETGSYFDINKSAPKTHDLMRKIREAGLKNEKRYTEFSMGNGITMCFKHK